MVELLIGCPFKKLKTFFKDNKMLPKSIIKVSIIGTAGRGDSKQGLTKELYAKMVRCADDLIQKILKDVPKDSEVHLVSGGAAWSDHIAVSLFLSNDPNYKLLTLHLPCPLIFRNGEHVYHDNGLSDWRANPARSSNRYHKEFSAEIGRNSLRELHDATIGGANVHVHNGFFMRNSEIARSDVLIAFTWGLGDVPIALHLCFVIVLCPEIYFKSHFNVYVQLFIETSKIKNR
jgi:hypothetical protein